MKNADLPAMPTHEIISACSPDGNSGPYDYTVVNPGLTKREELAARFMAAWIIHHGSSGDYGYSSQAAAQSAIQDTDALLAELERTK